MSELKNPHDVYFKRTLGNTEITKDFIFHYFPDHIKKHIELEKITPINNEIISENLKKSQSDLLYKIQYKNEDAFLYFLFEHKSYLSNNISLQMLKYLTGIWESIWQQKNELPIILPVVFYHGNKKWNIGTELKNILASYPKELAELIPNYNYILYNFSPYSNQEIRGGIQLRLFLEVVKYINTDTFKDRLTDFLYLMKELNQKEKGIDYIKTTIQYILNVNETLQFEELKSESMKIIPERSEEIMTIAEKLREKGKKEGEKKGEKKGVKKGVKKVLIKQLRTKFGEIPGNYLELIDKQDQKTLEKIAEEILEIDSISELDKWLK